jgi:EmrB/QacA subfamily drug resistance transporter
MVFIDGTVTNVALPILQQELQATVVEVQWVVEAYALFLAALILPGGSMGDHFGRRRMFVLGVAIFASASALCGLAPDANTLILARAAQGVGGALLTPGSLAIISASFEGERRGKAIGTWSGFTAITTALGPVLGGWLVEHASWRWVFFLNIPLAVAVVAVALWRVPESKDDEARGLDWLGAALVTVGLGGVVFGLIESANLGFGAPAVFGALVVGVVALAAFLWVEAHVPNPMMPLALFRSRTFTGANVLTFLLYGGLAGSLFFVPFNLIQVQGYTPTEAGAALLPFIVIMFVLSRWTGGLVARVGAKLPLTVGPAVVAISSLLYARVGIGGAYWESFFPAVAVQGIGMAITVAPLTTVVMSSVSARHSGLASGVNNAVSRTAGLLAIAVLGIVVLSTFNAELDRQLAPIPLSTEARTALDAQRIKLAGAEAPADLSADVRQEVERAIDLAFLAGFRWVMFIAGVLSLLSALIAWITIESRPVAAESAPERSGRGASSGQAAEMV